MAAVSEIAAGAANDLFKRCSLREGERKDKRREKEGSILGLDEQKEGEEEGEVQSVNVKQEAASGNTEPKPRSYSSGGRR